MQLALLLKPVVGGIALTPQRACTSSFAPTGNAARYSGECRRLVALVRAEEGVDQCGASCRRRRHTREVESPQQSSAHSENDPGCARSRWQSGTMVLRWALAGTMEAEKTWRRRMGEDDMSKLVTAPHRLDLRRRPGASRRTPSGFRREHGCRLRARHRVQLEPLRRRRRRARATRCARQRSRSQLGACDRQPRGHRR